ncbi:GNAT family N-acetyltransferase [Legionella drozanskii]|uniref:GNAT family acetyltransferase n=1 Tax=Legionella drozanskii LLAP-1 TaxID=1212489 RepID=A0A0W0SWH6_9GAMM|nr:GNAT family N-acetyltransferase [Legionella drozanskii]KTC87688.1 GNAT family acetyltransferase [Legionella drozanskii LLAP-1]
MKSPICNVEKPDYLQLIEIWEKSVRATHDFLPDKEIDELKPLILNNYFNAVLLKCSKNIEGKIIGFIGVAEYKIEMLFISPDVQGQGIGSALCQYAIEHLGATKVDVNEQNHRAREFYKKIGFNVVNRSELDGQGKPYPILHMEYRET